ncbi:hypothetical protein B0I37DRAFT_23632 [Chaetomium sp. MPI-CAGE-AT-0009]|nr:hypothetical protein B0I37DRAFT_23632 [Chaetomium sp. MPI-CAGE-AT-0009]
MVLSRRMITGGDLDDRDGNPRSRKAYAYQNGEDDEATDGSEQDSDGEDGVRMPLVDPVEEALADAAMARIRKAHAKGRQDVKLSKEELAAYQRRLQRMEDEERRQRRGEERVAIPISQLGPAFRPNRPSAEDDSPPPASSRTPSQAAADREPSSSPFQYTYVRGEQPANPRQSSDLASSRALSIAEPVPGSDPFQYMMGTRTSSHGAVGPVRNSVAEVDDIYASYGSGPTGGASRRQSGDPREAELSDDDDDRRRAVARVNSGSSSRPRHRESTDGRREVAPEPRPSRDRSPAAAKKSSTTSSTVAKRKSVLGSTKSVRKKK